MHRLPLAAAVAVLGTSAVAADTERYRFSDFDTVNVSSGISVIIREGQDYAVEAEARRGNLRRLIIEENGDTLSISRNQRLFWFGFWNNDRFVVRIDLPDLTEVEASSGSSIEITGAGSGDLEITASSGSTISFEGGVSDELELSATSGSTVRGSDINASDVSVRAGSGSSVKLSGECDEIKAKSQSGSTLDAQELECTSGDLEASGGSTLKAHTNAAVKARASGGASMTILGSPVSADTSSSGGASMNLR